jgi:hypothetical protein
MNGFVRVMDDVFAAIIFSEVGEHGIALEFLAVPAASARMKTIEGNHSRSHAPLVPEGDP